MSSPSSAGWSSPWRWPPSRSPTRCPPASCSRAPCSASATGLLAVGLVLTYRTTRIINFAYGAMGSLGGGLAAALTEGKGWNWGQAALVGVADRRGGRRPRRAARHPPLRQRPPPRADRRHHRPGPAARRPRHLPADLARLAGVHPPVRDVADRLTFNVDPVTFTGNDLLLLAVVADRAGRAVVVPAAHRGRHGRAGHGREHGPGPAARASRSTSCRCCCGRSPAAWPPSPSCCGPRQRACPLDAAAGPTVLLPALAAAVMVGHAVAVGRVRRRRRPRRPRPARAVERRHRGAHVGGAARRHRGRAAAAAPVGAPGRGGRVVVVGGRRRARAAAGLRQAARGPRGQGRAAASSWSPPCCCCPCSAPTRRSTSARVTLAYGARGRCRSSCSPAGAAS